MSRCPACGESLSTGLRDWHRVCRGCTYEGSVLEPHIQAQAPGGDLDEAARRQALEPLRRQNFTRLRQRIGTPTLSCGRRPRLLDVGCAHGWFLEQARGDFDVTGIEPDREVADAARACGLSVRTGYFPEALSADERFDVIVFNDVLEHLPDVPATLAACRRHLHSGGLLVVNAPDRRGALYRISKMLLRLGRPGSFNRMWQEGFPSPHVHYFDAACLVPMAGKHGFHQAATFPLASLSVRGLYARVRYAQEVPAWKALAITAAVASAMPLLMLMPSDITVWTFRVPEAPR